MKKDRQGVALLATPWPASIEFSFLNLALDHRLASPRALAARLRTGRQHRIVGELLALRWQDIDWDARLIRVRRNFTRGEFGTPKSRRSSRAVPLATRLAEELRAHHDRNADDAPDQGLVFSHPATGRVLDPSKLRRRFVSYAAAAGVRPVRFHDLRHAAATFALSQGFTLEDVKQLLGHSSIVLTSNTYGHVLEQRQRQVALGIDAVLGG